MLERIKQLCAENGLTVNQLEIKLGFSIGTIGHWKESMPKADKLLAVAKALKVSMDYLLYGTEEEAKTPATEDGSGRYGLKKSDWWGIGNCFKHELNMMARPPEYLANVSGIPVDRVSAFLSGEAEISKVEIEALAKAVGKPLQEIIHGYAMAFDREESSLDLSEFLQVFGSLRPENQQRLFRIAAKTMQSEQAATQLLELSEKAFDTLPESGQE